ncbi:MAG: DNA-binding protein [Woeseiaceae bacterium]
MAKRKSFALRIDENTLEAMQRWARDDLRSLNAQIEFVLRAALQDAGRLPKRLPPGQDEGGGSMD